MATLTSKLIITVVLIFSFTTKAMEEHDFSTKVRALFSSVDIGDLEKVARDPNHSSNFLNEINDLLISLKAFPVNDLVELCITLSKGGNQDAAHIVYWALKLKSFRLDRIFPKFCGEMESILPVFEMVSRLVRSGEGYRCKDISETDLENYIEAVYQNILSRANERRFLPEKSFKRLSEGHINLIQISNDKILMEVIKPMEVIEPVTRSNVSKRQKSRLRCSSQTAQHFPPVQRKENPAANVGQNPL